MTAVGAIGPKYKNLTINPNKISPGEVSMIIRTVRNWPEMTQ